MTPEQQNRAIAEACGATHHRWGNPLDADPRCEDCCQFQSEDPDNYCVLAEIPNYVGDLNAIHSAILSLPENERDLVNLKLMEITAGNFDFSTAYDMDAALHASAEQWAEAFLKAKWLWKTRNGLPVAHAPSPRRMSKRRWRAIHEQRRKPEADIRRATEGA